MSHGKLIIWTEVALKVTFSSQWIFKYELSEHTINTYYLKMLHVDFSKLDVFIFFDFTTLEKYSWKEKQECSKRLAHSNFRIMNFWGIRSGAYKSLIRSMHRKIWVICHLFVSSITHVKRTWIKIGIGVGLYYLVGHKDA